MEPEKKIVTFPVWDQETDEIIEMEMDADAYEAMCKAEAEHEARMEEARRRDWEDTMDMLRFRDDDDY